MSNNKGRRFYDVAIEPSTASLLSAASQGTSQASTRSSLPNYVALNFNFKPDSAHDFRKGALFQSGSSSNVNTDWQLELESTETEAGPSTDSNAAARQKQAHVFTGPQTAAKAYDLVLIWDDKMKGYRLDRIASTFTLKYERSKTLLSNKSQDVWDTAARKPSRRASANSTVLQSISDEKQEGIRRTSNQVAQPPSAIAASKRAGELKLRGKTSSVAAPVRRSSRISVAVEMEEFDDRSGSPAETSIGPASRSKRSSVSQENELRSKEDSKRVKLPDTTKERSSNDEPPVGLRRSRRRSSQAQAEEDPLSSPHTDPVSRSEPTSAAKIETAPHIDAEDDDLALELERELLRELDVEMRDRSEVEERPPPSAVSANLPAKSFSNRSLSPVSRLKRGERQMKVSTPKAHTPDLDDASLHHSSAFSRSHMQIDSPYTDRSSPGDADRVTAAASIGLGLHQTGVGITPTASPRLEVANPAESVSTPAAASSAKDDGDGNPEGEEDENDDDLQDFAAELDLSLAEGPDVLSPVVGGAVDKRRSSRAITALQSISDAGARSARKAYGLGGPRQEEEELEDSD
ncbi:EAF domain-containing protein [Pseudozyma hubeiensis]|nr:EAF domain-containing protein [Pseudozyma hubeiensis]